MNTDTIANSNADDPTKALCSLSQNWWLFALRGVLALIFAAIAFWMPQSALLATTLVFGAFSLVNGAFNLVAAVRHIQKKERWGWLLFSGIVGMLTGVVVLVAPLVATMVMASFLWASVGVWAIFTGVLEISAAVRLRQEIKGEIWLAFSGLLSIVLGAIVLWIFFSRPAESFLAAGWLLGFYAAVYGVTLLFLSWRLRRTRQG
ncbi:TPA: HdeD family acid-resistance protein [Stenotrophomonas maltophilia]|nr:HdeD family acid-resistance protein [Stenotrophomonas maltophilia]